MDRILVPVTSHAGWARDVADAVIRTEAGTPTEAIVAHVFEDGEAETARSNLEVPADDHLSLDELAARKQGVSATIDVFDDAEISIKTQVRGLHAEKNTANAIIRAAAAESIDRIYLYARNRSPTGKAVFGSTIQRVVLNATCPVVVYPFGAR